MRYEIVNHRQVGTFPTCRGNSTLNPGQVYVTDDAEFAEDLKAYPTVSVKEMAPDLSNMTIMDIRKHVKHMGLKQGFGMSKADLLKLIRKAG